MLKKNDIIELTVTDMTFEGLGVARYSSSDLTDFVIFIHGAVVGDIVDCRIVKVLKNHAFAIIENIISPSEDRVHPACPSFSKCGGCTYQNINYETELRYKRNCIVNAFEKNCPDYGCIIEDVEPSPSVAGYRNKVQYPISADGEFGFFAKRSHRIVKVNSCLLQDPDFSEIIDTVSDYIKKYNIKPYDEETGIGYIRHLYLRKAHSTGEIMVCLVTTGSGLPHKEQFTSAIAKNKKVKSIYLNINKRRDNVILGRECILIWGSETITDILCGLKFKISPLSFYQTNSEQTEQLYNFVTESGFLTENDILLDVCSGIGTITLTAAQKVKHAYGVEIVRSAVENAVANASVNKIKNADFFLSDMSNISELRGFFTAGLPNVITLDPPRKGLTEETITALKEYLPEKLVYISCNPATQARDIQRLNEGEKLYEIERIKPFDMFPRTGHVECVCFMTLIKNQ